MGDSLGTVAMGAPKPADSVLLEKQIPDDAVAKPPAINGFEKEVNGTVNGLHKDEPTTRPGNLFTEQISADYHNDLDTGYYIPTVTLHQPENRRLKVITIGAGFSGIMLAHDIERDCQNIEHIIYEKASEVGGTWVHNRYPNAGCDAPSAAYQANFALNPDWPSFYSKSEPINNYLIDVVDKLDLRKYMIFNSKVVDARFDEEKGTWNLTIVQTRSDGTEVTIRDDCDLLLGAIGILDRWEYPKIPGLNKFKGKVMHTAGWPKDYQQEQWKGEHVAVIGSGASAVQTIPGMQPFVKEMDVYIRTPIWFFAHVNPDGTERPQNYQYTDEEKKLYREDPDAMLAHAKQIENQTMKLFHLMLSYGPAQKKIRETLTTRMRRIIKDDRLFENLLPKWGVGCRRIAPGDPCMEALQKPNVKVHFTGVASIDETGLIGDDGVHRPCDTIVCATGFDVSYRPPFDLVGLNGVNLRKKWEKVPEGYLGLAVPDIPNYLLFIGPSWPVENGSVMGPLNGVVNYAIKIIKKMQKENIKYWVPKQSITDEFNSHTQTWIKGTVWEENCNAWYKDRTTGRVNAVWPGSALHYMEAIKEPRYEDFDIKYHNKINRFAYLGVGYVPADLDFSPTADRSPYLNREAIDPRFLQ